MTAPHATQPPTVSAHAPDAIGRAGDGPTPSIRTYMGPAWRRLFDHLDRLEPGRPADRPMLTALLSALPGDERWIDAVAAFSELGYRRNRIERGPAYEALLMCWHPGQRSPVHDHAGSLCGVRVLRGVAAETRYTCTPTGELVPGATRSYVAGSVCVSFDSDTHVIGNDEPGDLDLITLHVYSPPLAGLLAHPIREPFRLSFRARSTGFAQGDGI